MTSQQNRGLPPWPRFTKKVVCQLAGGRNCSSAHPPTFARAPRARKKIPIRRRVFLRAKKNTPRRGFQSHLTARQLDRRAGPPQPIALCARLRAALPPMVCGRRARARTAKEADCESLHTSGPSSCHTARPTCVPTMCHTRERNRGDGLHAARQLRSEPGGNRRCCGAGVRDGEVKNDAVV